ncbi:histidine kinase [Roseivirga sp. E12]|uniref:tetratricopeptide repeat-containing sensor histidine kinase n=1 Tax=Roseivirga sp. E12 TaxID=2819237 RepID=UPI001ABBEDC2|nr:histidine kinase [Roseivirga sp. E12]MBO3697158.1 histidine kinase [Roseivirga sp. E12]
MTPIKMRAGLIIGILLSISQISFAQNDEEKALTGVLDSLYRVIFTFNYTDESTYEPRFSQFANTIDSVLKISSEKQYKPVYYKAVNVRFIHLKYQDEVVKSRDLLDETIDYALDNGDSLYYAQFTYFIGNLFSRQDKDDSALVYYEKALDISRQIGRRQVEAASVNAIAVTYAGLDRDDLAVKYYYKSLVIAEDLKDSSQIATAVGNLATAYSRMEVGDSSLYYAKRAYDLALVTNEIAVKWHALNSLTIGSYLKRDYRGALRYANQLRDEVTPIEEYGFLITSHLYRSKTLAAQNRLNEAYSYAEKSLELAREFEVTRNEMNALNWLVELASDRRDYKNALSYEQERSVLQDSLNQVKANQRIEQLSAKYENQEKEDKIAALNLLQKESKARERTQLWFFGTLTLLLIVSFLYFYKLFKSRIEVEQLAKQKAKNDLLRSQLNPHFLFNALSSIQLFLIDKGQGSNALNYLSKFAKLMRRILENSRRDLVSLDAEVSTLRHYLDLQKIRFDNRFDYRMEIDTADDISEILIPPMFAQPFIENSLEHGIAEMENGLILVSFKQEDDVLRFKVEDNGVGLSKATSLKKAGLDDDHEPMATKITEDRIELLKKQLKRNISFIAKDKLSDNKEIIGTEVIFELPIQFVQ